MEKLGKIVLATSRIHMSYILLVKMNEMKI